MQIKLVIVTVLLLVISQFSFAQSLPSKIRGYKVYNANITVRDSSKKSSVADGHDAVVTIGKPEITDIGFSGVVIEITAEIAATDQSGRVDFLTFNDFRINDFAIDIEEYKHEFSFKKGVLIPLPRPARITIGTLNMARAARRELIESKKDWLVTGTVFVFGKFKKFGFGFKRVVPVKIEMKIDNPLISLIIF